MKKIFMLFYILFFIVSCTIPPNTSIDSISDYRLKFKKLKQMKKGVYGMGSATDGKYIYSVNGSVMGSFIKSGIPLYRINQYGDVTGGGGKLRAHIGESKRIYRYDTRENKWSVNPAEFRPKTFLCAEYIDGELYIFNGHERIFIDDRFKRIANKNLEIFDVNTGKVSYGTNNPYAAWYSGSTAWNNKIYVFGGSIKEGVFSDKLLVYDPYYDEWTHLTDLPKKMQTRGEIINGNLYIFGGYNGIAYRDIYKYNISEDEWSHLGYMPRSLSSTAIAKHGDYIWLVGDYINLSRVAVFNVKTNEFHILKSNMKGRRHAGAEIIDNKLYVYGGNRESSGSFLSSIQVADLLPFEYRIIKE